MPVNNNAIGVCHWLSVRRRLISLLMEANFCLIKVLNLKIMPPITTKIATYVSKYGKFSKLFGKPNFLLIPSSCSPSDMGKLLNHAKLIGLLLFTQKLCWSNLAWIWSLICVICCCVNSKEIAKFSWLFKDLITSEAILRRSVNKLMSCAFSASVKVWFWSAWTFAK